MQNGTPLRIRGGSLRVGPYDSPSAAGTGRLGLSRFIKRLHQQTRWHVYVRVLPVVFVAVMLVGAFGWLVFTRYATDKLGDYERQEVAFLVENLRQKTLVETMGLDARKSDLMRGQAPTLVSGDGFDCPDWMSDMLQFDHLAGMALVGTDSEDALADSARHLLSLCVVDSLSGPINESRLEIWFASNDRYFDSEVPVDGRPGKPVPEAPVLAHRSPWHATYVFPPVLIEEVRGGSQVSAGGDLAALLPVLVRTEQSDEAAKGAAFHTVYFLSLNKMLAETLAEHRLGGEHGVWWCIVNHQGRVIASDDNIPVVGSSLQNQHRTATHGPFAVASGAEIAGDWHPGSPWQQSFFGDRLAPWVVTAGQSGDFPLAILVGHEARELRSTSLGFMFAVIGVALLALAVSLLGVTRVVGRISARLMTLSHNMEQVAAGDYSRRIPTAMKDEVGRLINYFNLMAASLDETQRQLTEKTSHLQTALENRQLLDRAKDDFLVLISHEVRTPLTAIMGGVNILKCLVERTLGSDLEVLERLNVIEVVKIIEGSGERLHSFMNDAIQMTSIQSSDQELSLKIASIGSLVELGLCGVREMAQVRNIEVVNGLEHEFQWQVLCDEAVLRLAFEKILKNAVVHNYDKGRVVIREVTEVPGLGAVADLPRVEDTHRLRSLRSFEDFIDLPITWRAVEIFNTGEAIPVERCEALFGKFELVGRIEHHQRGSGLSLPIAQAAVENHGGRIYVHSVKLQGNGFYLLLPTVATVDLEVHRTRLEADGRTLLIGPGGQEAGDGVGGGPRDENID